MKVERLVWTRVNLKYPIPGVGAVNSQYYEYMKWIAENSIKHLIAMPRVGFPDFIELLPEDAVIFKLVFGL